MGEAGDALFAAPERPPEPAPEKKPRKPLRNERARRRAPGGPGGRGRQPRPTSTGRSTTRCPSSSPTRRSPARGCGCGSPAGWSTASCSRGRTPASTPAAWGGWRRSSPRNRSWAPSSPALCRAVADRYAGTLADVLRLAVPPRHARVEAETPAERRGPEAPEQHGWGAYPRGPALLEALAAHRPAHAVWQALPGEDWPARLAEAAATTAAAGRGAVLVVPDRRDLDRVQAACEAVAGADAVVALAADLGPAERYRRWLAVARGQVRIVVGTRAAAFAPVVDPGLIAVWDDGDDTLAEPRAPYPHARDVAMTRAHRDGAALLVGRVRAHRRGRPARRERLGPRRRRRPRHRPRPRAPGQLDRRGRPPAAARPRLAGGPVCRAWRSRRPGRPWRRRAGARPGPAPRLPAAVACARCREPARCRRCAGPWRCRRVPTGCRPAAGAGPPTLALPLRRLRLAARALAVGSARTAEELGRAFPQTVVRRLRRRGRRCSTPCPAGPALVVATPGAEPIADGGYGAALLLDGAVLLARPELRAGEETLRRWFGAAALVRPASEGGRVVVIAESSTAAVQALVRWDPVGHAATELASRTELSLPPAMRLAAVDGPPPAVADLLAALPDDVEVLGPVELPPRHEAPGRRGAHRGRRALPRPRAPHRGPHAGPRAARRAGRALGAQGARAGARAARPPRPALTCSPARLSIPAAIIQPQVEHEEAT